MDLGELGGFSSGMARSATGMSQPVLQSGWSPGVGQEEEKSWKITICMVSTKSHVLSILKGREEDTHDTCLNLKHSTQGGHTRTPWSIMDVYSLSWDLSGVSQLPYQPWTLVPAAPLIKHKIPFSLMVRAVSLIFQLNFLPVPCLSYHLVKTSPSWEFQSVI